MTTAPTEKHQSLSISDELMLQKPSVDDKIYNFSVVFAKRLSSRSNRPAVGLMASTTVQGILKLNIQSNGLFKLGTDSTKLKYNSSDNQTIY